MLCRCCLLNRCIHWSLAVLLCLAAYCMPAAQVLAGDDAQRPRIGLALSGGGARGAAHVGVLRVLEAQRIPVDYIAGTSMGSIVGGLYASGLAPDDIEDALAAMDWEHIFSDDPPRQERSFRRKRDDDLYLIKAKPGISDDGELKFPTGAIQGQKFDLALRQLTLPVSTETDFDNLRIPFRAVASDLGNGQSVVLSSGDLATAMRASMAVPGAFAATEIDGKLLVDGGITNNIPIDVVRSMGADIVIAVDISSPYLSAEEVEDVFGITAQLTNMLTRSNADRQIATLTDQDILIVPDLADITSADFERSVEAVALGEKAAGRHRDELARLSLAPDAYRGYRLALGETPDRASPVVHFIDIENDSGVGDSLIRERLHQPVGGPLDRDRLERDIGNIYGLELFQTVEYDLVEKDGLTGLLVRARARRWGPNYLQLGLTLSGNEEGDSFYNLGFGYLRTGINEYGGEIRTRLQVGREPLVSAEWYQPLDPLSRYFVNAQVAAKEQIVSFYDGQNPERLADFVVDEALLELAMGREFGVYGEGRLGYRYLTGDVELQTGTPGWPEFDFDTGELFARIYLDRLDNFYFPQSGWLGRIDYAAAREAYGGDGDFDQVELYGTGFYPLGNGHIAGIGGWLGTTLDGEASIQDRFRLGGLLSLSGFASNQLSGEQAGVLTAVYYRRFDPLPYFQWYLGGSTEYGGVWEDKQDIGDDGLFAGSLFLGADTPIGPVYLGVGLAEGGHRAVFFNLGRTLVR
ncbi:patatin [Marinobacterium nitratireducens]|uniref:Patatin n=1 Tax=Marinobacterium nitratireducens TaxID=518897 RepID=A0A917ZQL6_9GAMM|nr:patatin-like phospholipase family protein [Marinobacterium nitratireducens]GGO88493.1 patatin [Marinobacterium nitratireducens]